MTSQLIERAEQGEYQKLFLQDLNWSRPDHPPVTCEIDNRQVTATNVSAYKGLRIWVVNEKPNSKVEATLDQHLANISTDRILIFHDNMEQVWRWPVRRTIGNTTTTRLSRHLHRTGDSDHRFANKLEAIQLPFDVTLDSNAVLAKVRQAFDVEAQNETKHASKLMARLYMSMEKAYPATASPQIRDHEISVTLARILFLMFGDDTDMWAENLFQDFVLDHTAADGSDIGAKLSELFAYLDTPPEQRGTSRPNFHGFRYVNGGIFKERLHLPGLNAEFRTAVLDACDRDWKTISPAIFGSMFQSVRDAATRRQLGEHYTSEENILKTLNPLFLDELRAEFAHIRTLGKMEANRLRKLREKLGRIRFMDPACGCGNFIIVAYRELRDLELAIMERLQEITGDSPMLLANYGLKITLDHFYGIEIDEWPARIAETAMFLIDRQSDLKLNDTLGWAPDRLPIQEQATIAVGNAIRLDWTAVCPPSGEMIIAGNPPFLGPHTRSAEQLADLQLVWGSKDLGRLDYVTAWHRKCVDYFTNVEGGRFALVSTSSIAQGDQVARLFPTIFDAGWRLRFAHQTFAWTSEAVGAAAVHCVITGFDKYEKSVPVLYEYEGLKASPHPRPVENINAYLTAGPNIIVTPRPDPLSPVLGRVVLGSMAKDGGYFIVGPDEHERFAADPIASKYLRPYVGSKELLNGGRRWCIWLEGMDFADLNRSRLLKERVDAVKAFRLSARAASTKDFAAIPHLFTQRAAQTSPFVCIPGLSSEGRPYLPCSRVEANVIASHANYQVLDPDGLQFAILSSAMFMAWQKAIGGRMKSDIRFAVRTVWNNFPMPELSGCAREALIAAGEEVRVARAEHSGLSLAYLYRVPGMPSDLLAAHSKLDEAMDGLLGAGQDPDVTERQRLLFARYAELAGPLGLRVGRNK